MDERFRKAEDEYFRLKGLLETGRITRDQFDAGLKDLLVQDAQGRYWMVGADTGKWYAYDGKNWIEANPYPAGSAAPPAPARKFHLLPVVALVVVVLLAAGGILFAASQGLLKIGGASPPAPTRLAAASPTLGVALGNTATPTATNTLLPTASPSPTSQASTTDTATTAAPSPTQTSAATAPSSPTNTPTGTNAPVSPAPATSTPTRVLAPSAPSPTPTSALPTSTPTLAAPPGVYVTNMRVDPAQPKNLQLLTFYPTFVNTTGGGQNFNWCVEFFSPDNLKKSFGITHCLSQAIPAGSAELATDGNYRIVSGGQCLPLLARAIYIDPSAARVPFLQPNGNAFWFAFQVCPA